MTRPLSPHIGKVISSICFLISEAERLNFTLTQYDIVKSIFLADRSHLNKWGRPITFDNYFAMEHGPVPNLSYDLLKDNEYAKRRYGLDKLPWVRKALDARRFSFHSEGSVDVDALLSESDKEALTSALETVKILTFGQIRRLTHEDPAYVEAWREDGGRNAYPMRFELLFEGRDDAEAQAETIAEYSAYVSAG